MTTAFEAWREAGQTWSFQGHDIFVREHGMPGTGSTLLCLHGFPTASWDWHAIWDGLCARFGRVIAPDMLGFGWSDKPRDHVYSVFEQATLCEQLLQARGIRRVHLLAHDFGDTVAQELLARHEERQARGDDRLIIESCVLLNGGLFPEVHRMRPIQRLLLTPLGPLLAGLVRERQFHRSLSAVLGPRTQPSMQELHEFWLLNSCKDGQKIMHKLLRYIPERRQNRTRWVGVLTTTTVPLRFINGPMDPVSGEHMAARYRELVPQADVAMLANHIGHYPQVEDPEGTLAAFLAFHDRLGRG